MAVTVRVDPLRVMGAAAAGSDPSTANASHAIVNGGQGFHPIHRAEPGQRTKKDLKCIDLQDAR
jgi:hypothetical protein